MQIQACELRRLTTRIISDTGAISSSAPLVATVDFSQYLEVVGDALT